MDIKRLEDKLDKSTELLSNKLEQTNSRLADIDKTVAIYNEQLKLHIEGTVQNREAIQMMRQELEPIKTTYSMGQRLLKFMGFLGSAGLLASILKYFNLP